jgi:YggT family protein
MNPIFYLIDRLLAIYIFIVIAAAIYQLLAQFGIINTRQPFVNAIGEFLWRATEPALRPIRSRMPNLGPIDVSPLVLIVLISVVQYSLGWVSLQFGI